MHNNLNYKLTPFSHGNYFYCRHPTVKREWSFNSNLHDQVICKDTVEILRVGIKLSLSRLLFPLFQFALRKEGERCIYGKTMHCYKETVIQVVVSVLHFVSEYTYRAHNEQHAWLRIMAAQLGSLKNQEPKSSDNEGWLLCYNLILHWTIEGWKR